MEPDRLQMTNITTQPRCDLHAGIRSQEYLHTLHNIWWLLLFYDSSGYANALHCNVTRTLLILFIANSAKSSLFTNVVLNLLAPEFYILLLAHPVCKMWIIQKPEKVALWNKRHFEEKNGKCVAYLKYSVLIFVEKNIYKMEHLVGSGTPVLYIGRAVLKG
jgi:hypothetical protein